MMVMTARVDFKKIILIIAGIAAAVLALILMTIPGTPKDLLSYFAGLTPLKTWQWLGIVAVSRIPSLVTSTLSGSLAGEENYVLSAAVFVFTILISAAGLWYYRRLCKEKSTEQ